MFLLFHHQNSFDFAVSCLLAILLPLYRLIFHARSISTFYIPFWVILPTSVNVPCLVFSNCHFKLPNGLLLVFTWQVLFSFFLQDLVKWNELFFQKPNLVFFHFAIRKKSLDSTLWLPSISFPGLLLDVSPTLAISTEY